MVNDLHIIDRSLLYADQEICSGEIKTRVKITESIDYEKDFYIYSSPIYKLGSLRNRNKTVYNKNCWIFFIFSCTFEVYRTKIFRLIKDDVIQVFLTHGFANIVLIIKSSDATLKSCNRIKKHLEKKQIEYEKWDIVDSCVTKKSLFVQPKKIEKLETSELSKLFKLLQKWAKKNDVMQREIIHPIAKKLLFEKYNHLNRDSIKKSLSSIYWVTAINWYTTRYDPSVRESEIWRIFDYFSSYVHQKYSGFLPLDLNTCNIGSYSFFGIGKSLRSCELLGEYIQKKMYTTGFTKAISNIVKSDSNGDFIFDFSNKSLLLKAIASYNQSASFVHFKQKGEENCYEDEVTKIMFCFSRRDGYTYKEPFLILPLTVLSKGNAKKMSFISITHELCHIFANFIVNECVYYIRRNNETFRNFILSHNMESMKYEDFRIEGSSFVDVIAKNIIILNFIKTNINSKIADKNLEAKINEYFKSINREKFSLIEEIIVIVLDLVYFHRNNYENLLNSYWSHWLSIEDYFSDTKKIEDYLLRSSIAIFASKLMESQFKNFIGPNEVYGILRELEIIKNSNFSEVFKEHSKLDNFFNTILEYYPIAVYTVTFLYSEDFLNDLWKTEAKNSEDIMKQKESLNVSFKNTSLDNPLYLLDSNLYDDEECEKTTFWFLNAIEYYSTINRGLND